MLCSAACLPCARECDMILLVFTEIPFALCCSQATWTAISPEAFGRNRMDQSWSRNVILDKRQKDATQTE